MVVRGAHPRERERERERGGGKGRTFMERPREGWARSGGERARKRVDREKLAFSRLKINMHGSDSETFILPGLISF